MLIHNCFQVNQLCCLWGYFDQVEKGSIILNRQVSLNWETYHLPSSRTIWCTLTIHWRLWLIVLLWLWINSGIHQWCGHGVATGALFGMPSDILIKPHFHSQGTVSFVLAGVCESLDQQWCKNCIDKGIQLTFKGERGMKVFKKYFNPPKSLSLWIGLLRNFWKNIPAPYKFHSPPRINWCIRE